MRMINIHEAKTNLSRLVDEAANGDSFVIAKAGKPRAKVTRIDEPENKPARRMGFLKGKLKVPDNFDSMFADEIERMFSGQP